MKKQLNVETMNERCKEVAELLKSLAHPQRLMITCLLGSMQKIFC